jgi:hypothetical protein
MLAFARVFAALALAALMSGCISSDSQFIKEGVGTTLYSPSTADTTNQQDQYVTLICRQAGLQFCETGPIAPLEWSLFVQAGMNDIDERCDIYLAWLDSKRRNTEPILKEIHDVQQAASAILTVSGAGSSVMNIVVQAFGLAANTFTNVSSRLLFDINQSTVQAVVLTRQREYRTGILALPRPIDNRPAAMHALRSYLRLCMPFTIENEINTAVTLFERGGGVAPDPLVTPRTIAAQIIRSPRQQVTTPRKPVVIPDSIRIGPFERQLGGKELRAFQKAACLRQTGQFTNAARDAIIGFLNSKGLKDTVHPDRITDKDGEQLHGVLDGGGCRTDGDTADGVGLREGSGTWR